MYVCVCFLKIATACIKGAVTSQRVYVKTTVRAAAVNTPTSSLRVGRLEFLTDVKKTERFSFYGSSILGSFGLAPFKQNSKRASLGF